MISRMTFIPEYKEGFMRLTVLSAGPLVALSLLLALSACGVKPNELDPPPGVKKDSFPKTYPDPANDPKPEKHS